MGDSLGTPGDAGMCLNTDVAYRRVHRVSPGLSEVVVKPWYLSQASPKASTNTSGDILLGRFFSVQ